jgi:hypothetical protein
LLRYHDQDNWPIIREALVRMGRRDLIGSTDRHLVPSEHSPLAVKLAAVKRHQRPMVANSGKVASPKKGAAPVKPASKSGRQVKR